jgi:hypothetical protein
MVEMTSTLEHTSPQKIHWQINVDWLDKTKSLIEHTGCSCPFGNISFFHKLQKVISTYKHFYKHKVATYKMDEAQLKPLVEKTNIELQNDPLNWNC